MVTRRFFLKIYVWKLFGKYTSIHTYLFTDGFVSVFTSNEKDLDGTGEGAENFWEGRRGCKGLEDGILLEGKPEWSTVLVVKGSVRDLHEDIG